MPRSPSAWLSSLCLGAAQPTALAALLSGGAGAGKLPPLGFRLRLLGFYSIRWRSRSSTCTG